MAGFRTDDPEANAARLRRRFSRASARSLNAPERRRRMRYAVIAIAAFAALFSAAWAGAEQKGWPLPLFLRHIAAAPNCAHARAVGLAPARTGAPGYYDQHDRNRNGIACEPVPWR